MNGLYKELFVCSGSICPYNFYRFVISSFYFKNTKNVTCVKFDKRECANV